MIKLEYYLTILISINKVISILNASRTEGEQLGDELNDLIKGLETVEDSIGNNESDYEKIIELNNTITNINNEINIIKENEKAKAELDKLLGSKQELENQINEETSILKNLENKIRSLR